MAESEQWDNFFDENIMQDYNFLTAEIIKKK